MLRKNNILIFFLLFPLFCLSAKETVKQILVINSYSANKESCNEIISSFSQLLNDDVSVTVEYMRCETNTDQEYWRNWMSQLFTSFSNKVEAVVILGNEGWYVYSHLCPYNWRHIPVVLGNVNRQEAPYMEEYDRIEINKLNNIEASFAGFNVFGFYTPIYVKENLQLIKAVKPNVRTVYFLKDNFNRILLPESVYYNDYDLTLQVIDGRKYSTRQVLDKLANADSDTLAVLNSTWFSDSENNPHANSMLHKELARRGDRYVFNLYDNGYNNEDEVGGYYVASSDVGAQLAALVNQIITRGYLTVRKFGEDPSLPNYHINQIVAQDEQYDFSSFPAGTIFHNTRSTFLERHPWILWVVGIFVVALIVAFLFVSYNRKNKERAFISMNQRMKDLLARMPDMAVIINSSMEIVDVVNPRNSLILGSMNLELAGKSLYYLCERDKSLVKAVESLVVDCRSALSSKKIINQELPIEKSDTTFYLEYRVMKLVNDQVVCFMQDVTDRVSKQRVLQESMKRLDLSVKASGNYPWTSDHIKELLTFRLPDNTFITISNEEYLSRIHPDDRSDYVSAYMRVYNGEEPYGIMDFRYRDSSSKPYRWLESCAVVTEKRENGKASRIVGLYRDITDQKKMTDELIMLRDKAEESNNLKSAFLANMSHEIRTPLNAIVGFSQMIAEGVNPEESAEYSKIIQSNSELLLQLIGDILDLSKIESGKMDFVFASYNLNEIFIDLKRVYESKIPANVDFVFELPDTGYIIETDRNRLTQVISNFISNAIKYTSKGSIRVGYTKQSSGLYLYVRDTGSGIPEEAHSRVFSRFSKFDKFVPGNGLGLSICKQITECLKGEIGFDSASGSGSTFWVKLPEESIKGKVDFSAESEAEVRADNSVEMEPVQPDKCKILIAEDNDSNYLLVSCILSKQFDLKRAVNGVEAVEMAESEHPDVILMDMKMPEMDGLTATTEIRRTQPDLPIIALTANAFDSDRERAIKAGCNDFLAKPVNKSDLMRMLEKYAG